MSSLFSSYRRGLVSFVAGAGLVAYGVVASAHLVLLVGIAVIAWGLVRSRNFRGAGR